MNGARIRPQRRGDGLARKRSHVPEILLRGLAGIEAPPDERAVEVGLVDRLVRVGPPEYGWPVRREHKQGHASL